MAAAKSAPLAECDGRLRRKTRMSQTRRMRTCWWLEEALWNRRLLQSRWPDLLQWQKSPRL